MIVKLNQTEMDELLKQDLRTEDDGGYQGLLVKLQRKLNNSTGEIDLSSQDLEKIPRYAFDYNQGGWEDRLIKTFSRHLGANLRKQ